MPTIDFSGVDRLTARSRRIADPDAAPLMVSWMKIIDDENRRGIMAGLDKDGMPMVPVKYRPAPTLPLGKVSRRKRGPYNPGVGGSLTSSEYRRLDGPPLAPRGTARRVITNLKLRYERLASGAWEAAGYWDQVVSRKGVPFLSAHFKGTNNLPRRDLRGVRPEGRDKARRAARAWNVIRSNSNG